MEKQGTTEPAMMLRISISIHCTNIGNSCANEDIEVKHFKPINKTSQTTR